MTMVSGAGLVATLLVVAVAYAALDPQETDSR